MIKLTTAFPILALVALPLAACSDAAGPSESFGRTEQALSTPDTTHTNVGSIVAYNAAGNLRQVCSGILIAPTVFLTAGHCTSDPRLAAGAKITFDPVVTNAAAIVTGTAHTAPDYSPSHYNLNSDSHDVGVITLDTPVTDRAPAALPTATFLSKLRPAPGTPITVVGYGRDQDGTTGGGVTYVNDMTRDVGTIKFRARSNGYIVADQVKADGACFGDSGGPDFLTVNGVEQLIAISVVVNGYDCNQMAWLYPLDGASTRAFLSGYVTLP